MGIGKGKRVIVTALAVAGGLVAAASSLGALDRPAVGAGGSVLVACDTDGVAASFTTEWDAADARYEIASVTVSGVSDACDGQRIRVALTGSAGAELAEASMTIPTSAATSFEVPLETPLSAEGAEHVHVVIGA